MLALAGCELHLLWRTLMGAKKPGTSASSEDLHGVFMTRIDERSIANSTDIGPSSARGLSRLLCFQKASFCGVLLGYSIITMLIQT